MYFAKGGERENNAMKYDVGTIGNSLTHNANLVTDQENTERPGMCILCFLTVAKHQGPYAHNQNDRHWPLQTTVHVRLHTLMVFAKTCVHQEQRLYPQTRKRIAIQVQVR